MWHIPLIIILALSPVAVFAFGPANPECTELGTCEFFDDPLNAMLRPMEIAFGDWYKLIIWIIIMGVLLFRVGNNLVVGIIGIIVAISIGAATTEPSEIFTRANLIGLVMIGVSMAVTMYQLLTTRINYPTN